MDKPSENVEIDLTEPVALTFSLKYLTNFCKASGLSDSVKLCLSSEVPLLVEYGVQNNSYLRFYLAPKVCPPLRIYIDLANKNRSATRSRRTTVLFDTSDMFSDTHVICIRSVCLVMGLVREIGENAYPQMSRDLVAKGTVAPRQLFTSSRGEKQIKEIIQHFTLHCAHIFILDITVLLASTQCPLAPTWLLTR